MEADKCNHQWVTDHSSVDEKEEFRIRYQRCKVKDCKARRIISIPLIYAPRRGKVSNLGIADETKAD